MELIDALPDDVDPELRTRLLRAAHPSEAVAARATSAMTDPDGQPGGHGQGTALRLRIIERKREVLLRLRREGAADDDVIRRLQTRLDVEEQRLVGAEGVD